MNIDQKAKAIAVGTLLGVVGSFVGAVVTQVEGESKVSNVLYFGAIGIAILGMCAFGYQTRRSNRQPEGELAAVLIDQTNSDSASGDDATPTHV